MLVEQLSVCIESQFKIISKRCVELHIAEPHYVHKCFNGKMIVLASKAEIRFVLAIAHDAIRCKLVFGVQPENIVFSVNPLHSAVSHPDNNFNTIIVHIPVDENKLFRLKIAEFR